MDEELERPKLMEGYELCDLWKTKKKFFKDFSFKLEGLSDESDDFFTYIIKMFGGTISKKAKYTLVEKSYFEKDENKERKDLYHINYILDSMKSGKLCNIELYRCDKTFETTISENQEIFPLILRNKIGIDKDASIRTKNKHKCMDKDNSGNTTVRNNFLNESNSDDDVPISITIKQFNTLSNDKTLKKYISKVQNNTPSNVTTSDSGSSSSNESVKIKSVPKSSDSSEDDSYLKNKTLSNVKSEVLSSSDNSTNNESDSEPSIRKRRRTEIATRTNLCKSVISNSSDESTNNESDSDSLIRKRRKKESRLAIKTNIQKSVSQNETNSKTTKRIWVDTKDLKNNGDNSKDNNKERNSCPDSGVEWTKSKIEERDDLKWLFEFDKNDQCKIKGCSLEPGIHESHCYPGRIISDEEKKVILKYLIKNNLIHRAKGIRTWEVMINEGYLTHRSADTLRNCLRRVMLPSICKFKLPVDILDQFLILDEKKAKGKKLW